MPLGEVAELRSGGTPDKKRPGFYSGDIPWITSADIDDRRVTGARSFITPDAIRQSAASVVEAGTVLLVTRTGVGKVAIAPHDVAFSQDITAISPERSSMDTSYLARYLRAQTAHFERHARGATIKGVTREVVASLPVPLLPLDEQRRIAQVLDAADALLMKRHKVAGRLESLTASLFDEMFGDPAVDEHGYGTRPLVDLVDTKRPITYGILKPGENLPGGVRYVRVVDMVDGGIRVSGLRRTSEETARAYRRSTLAEGDVLMSIRGHVGRIASVPAELTGGNITQDSARLAVPRASARYLTECLRAPGVQRWLVKHTKGAAVRGLNLGDVKRIPVLDAPLDKQLQFADRAALIDRLVAGSRIELALLRTLFASLQSRAFSGER